MEDSFQSYNAYSHVADPFDFAALQNANSNVAAMQELEWALAACQLAPHAEAARRPYIPGTVQCWDMSSLKQAISAAVAGTGQVREIIQSCVFSPREQAFTSLIKLCGNSGEWQKAIEIFEAMHFLGNVRPNTYTYSALIAACSTSRQWFKAIEVYELMKLMSLTDSQCHPNKVTFCAIISACEKGGYYDKALEVFQEMIHVGVPIDEWSLRAALSSCQKTVNWRCAQDIVLFLRTYHKGQTVLPPILYQASTVDELKHGVNVWLASKTSVDRSAASQQISDTDSYRKQQHEARAGGRAPWDMDTLKSAIFKAKAGSGEIAEALKTCTFAPRAQAFTTLINLCGRLRECDKAIEVFESMESVRGVKPNTYTYSALIAACSSSGEWEKALEIFRAMKKASVSNPDCLPNEVTYSTVITACQRGGLVKTAMDLYEEMLEADLLPDQGSFNSILSAVERNERFDLAEKILSDMHEQGLTGNPSIYCELIENYSKAGDWSKIVKLFEQLRRIQGHPEEAVRQEVMKALRKSGDKKWMTIDTSSITTTESNDSEYSTVSTDIIPMTHTKTNETDDDMFDGTGN